MDFVRVLLMFRVAVPDGVPPGHMTVELADKVVVGIADADDLSHRVGDLLEAIAAEAKRVNLHFERTDTFVLDGGIAVALGVLHASRIDELVRFVSNKFRAVSGRSAVAEG